MGSDTGIGPGVTCRAPAGTFVASSLGTVGAASAKQQLAEFMAGSRADERRRQAGDSLAIPWSGRIEDRPSVR